METPANVLPSAPPLRPPAETDWSAFVDTYGRVALAWFRQSGLPAEQIPIVVSEFLGAMQREFCAVASEPTLKFRSWLQYASHAGWCDALEKNESPDQAESAPKPALLASMEAHDQFLQALDDECSRQRRALALRQAQPLADEADWKAFALAVLEQEPLAEVAERFQCQDSAIRAALYRVRVRVLEEYQRLEETI